MGGDDWRDVLGDGLAIDLDLPWEPGVAAATASGVAARLLDAFALLDEPPPDAPCGEEARSDCRRLDLKLDLMLSLLAAFMRDRLPDSGQVTFSQEGVVTALRPDLVDRIALYPCPWLPLPLVLELDAPRIRGARRGARWRSAHPELREALGRWVFRTHRRAMARQRLREGEAPEVAAAHG